MLYRFAFLFTVLSLLCSLTFAQVEAKSQEGEFIIKLNPQTNIQSLINNRSIQGMPIRSKKLLSKRLNIWLLKCDGNGFVDTMTTLKKQPQIQAVQKNHIVTLRSQSTPNDSRFNGQWGLKNSGQKGGKSGADTSAELAWQISTGGKTAQGDDIVIAIVDGGFDLNHEDINYWKNEREIPGNGVDDDNNGYIDDFDGWNAYGSNGNVGGITSKTHGTHVAGIAGARGNNNIGVSGVNWNVKVLPIAGSSGSESIVVEAYSYVLELRALYNETNGAQGAFIVATNASFGVDFGRPEEFPIWTAIYDALGKEGVLNVAATANNNVNIDEVGDMPTAVESDFLIAVTNSTRTDIKFRSAGFGKKHIDLAAPGTDILSTLPNNNYGELTGTSMATPHVTGAIALIYSAAPTSLIEKARKNPQQVALIVRKSLLEATTKLSSLKDLTVTSGRLNLHNSLLMIQQQ